MPVNLGNIVFDNIIFIGNQNSTLPIQIEFGFPYYDIYLSKFKTANDQNNEN